MRRLGILWLALTTAALPLLAVRLVPFTAGWATPEAYFAPFRAVGALPLSLMLWDAFVIFGVAYGLPALVALAVLRYTSVVASAKHVLVFALLGVVFLRLAPAYVGAPFIWPSAWWYLGAELTFMLVAVIGVASLRVWPNNSSKPTPLRGAA